MSFINSGDPHSSQSEYRAPATFSEWLVRIAGGIGVIFVLLICAGAPILLVPLIGGAIVVAGVRRNMRDRRGASGYARAALWVCVPFAVAALFTETGQLMAGGLVQAVGDLFGGVGAGWSALGLLTHFSSLIWLSEPIFFGVLSGTAIAALQTWRRWRIGHRATGSVVATALSGDAWTRSIATLQIFAVNIVAAYLAAMLLETLGLFHAGGVGATAVAANMLGLILAGGGGGGGIVAALSGLLFVVLALLFALAGFAIVVGFCGGAPLALIGRFFVWQQILHAATASATRYKLSPPAEHVPGRLFESFFLGGVEGAISGAISVCLLAVLHLARIC